MRKTIYNQKTDITRKNQMSILEWKNSVNEMKKLQ